MTAHKGLTQPGESLLVRYTLIRNAFPDANSTVAAESGDLPEYLTEIYDERLVIIHKDSTKGNGTQHMTSESHVRLRNNQWRIDDSLWPRERFFPLISNKVLFNLLEK
jgi:hypothetical protein